MSGGEGGDWEIGCEEGRGRVNMSFSLTELFGGGGGCSVILTWGVLQLLISCGLLYLL